MDWWHLIVLLAVVAGYIIKQIVASQQEAAAEQNRLQMAQSPVRQKDDAEVAREKTDLDRRIEEATERQRDQEARVRVQRHIPMPAPVVRPRPVPRYQPPPAAEERALPEVVAAQRSELPRSGKSAPTKPQAAIPLPPVVPEAQQLAAMFAKAAPAAPLPMPAAAPAAVKKPSAAVVRQALELIKNRQSLAAAFILREVLDRPLSKRRRR